MRPEPLETHGCGGPALGRSCRIQKSARRNLADRTAVSRVSAALVFANKGSENSSLKRRPALRPLAGTATDPLHSGFRGSQPTFRLRNPCGLLNFPTDRYTVSAETAEPVSISLAPPGRTNNRCGRPPQEVAYPPLSKPGAFLLGLVHLLPTRVRAMARMVPSKRRTAVLYSLPDAAAASAPRGASPSTVQASGAAPLPLTRASRQRVATASSSPASGGLTRPRTRTSAGR